MPIVVWSPQHLHSVWKCLRTGVGARKVCDKHWCHLSQCTGIKIVKQLLIRQQKEVCCCFDLFFSLLVMFILTNFTNFFISWLSKQQRKNSESCYHLMNGSVLLVQFQHQSSHRLGEYQKSCDMHLADVLWEPETIYKPSATKQFENKYSMNLI